MPFPVSIPDLYVAVTFIHTKPLFIGEGDPLSVLMMPVERFYTYCGWFRRCWTVGTGSLGRRFHCAPPPVSLHQIVRTLNGVPCWVRGSLIGTPPVLLKNVAVLCRCCQPRSATSGKVISGIGCAEIILHAISGGDIYACQGQWQLAVATL